MIIVTHGKNFPVRYRQQFYYLKLSVIGILIFINKNILEPVSVLFKHLGETKEQEHRIKQEIIKIHSLLFFMCFLIRLVYFQYFLFVVAFGCFVKILRGDTGIFIP